MRSDLRCKLSFLSISRPVNLIRSPIDVPHVQIRLRHHFQRQVTKLQARSCREPQHRTQHSQQQTQWSQERPSRTRSTCVSCSIVTFRPTTTDRCITFCKHQPPNNTLYALCDSREARESLWNHSTCLIYWVLQSTVSHVFEPVKIPRTLNTGTCIGRSWSRPGWLSYFTPQACTRNYVSQN